MDWLQILLGVVLFASVCIALLCLGDSFEDKREKRWFERLKKTLIEVSESYNDEWSVEI